MKAGENKKMALAIAPSGGLAGWLLRRFRPSTHPRPQLALLERITLAPRQSLALVEAGGQRILVATSPEGAPAFYPLDLPVRPAGIGRTAGMQRSQRVSW